MRNLAQLDPLLTPNILLHLMRPDDVALLIPHLEYVQLTHRQSLSTADEEIEQIYFLEDGIASVTTLLPNIGVTEIGVFGRDGMSGSSVLLGSSWSPYDTFMQVEGSYAWRIATRHLMKAVQQSPSLQTFLLRFVQTQAVQTAYSAISNAHHRVEVRLARWLLMCHDRISGNQIYITHEYLSLMIAAQRSGVTLILHELEGQGIINARRGVVTIIDRERLEIFAGGAYGKPEVEYGRLIGPLPKGYDIFAAAHRHLQRL